ncbi:alpha-1-acid glycoprotein-like [Talpa occidentalis]|uniref:alpha-1-acid glycoprotein-like n=1 Tax=Talpa occidentalis TaxID=50954 RepID=UPI0023F87E9D|nr:alpha-1-acid glycoprotein-like [Talpa occidentalis]
MVLPWALTVLSLLPLLSAQSPECANFTAKPITNVTLDWLSGKWFYVAAIFRKPEVNQSAKMVRSAFFYFAPNQMEDKIYTREYQTIGDHCIYNSSHLMVQRKNGTVVREGKGQGEDRGGLEGGWTSLRRGPDNKVLKALGTENTGQTPMLHTPTLSPPENGTASFAYLLLSKNSRSFMFSAHPQDKQKMALSIFADKPQLSEEQLNEFHEVMECMGMHKSEIIPTDEKKDQCGPLEKQHEEERKKEQEGAKEE